MAELDNANSTVRSIYIEIRPPSSGKRKFTTGDFVRGTVRVQPTARPQRVTVALKGQLLYGGTKAPLFERELMLFTSPSSALDYDIIRMGVADDGRVDLPFDFPFPEKVDVTLLDPFIKREGFESTPGHVLPPSFAYETAIYRRNLIEYIVEANMWKESYSIPYLTAVQVIGFMPPSPHFREHEIHGSVLSNAPDNDETTNICIRTHKLVPHLQSNEGLLGKIKHQILRSDTTTPSAKFVITAKIPQTSFIGCTIPVSLIFEHLKRSEIVRKPPNVFLRRIRIRLLPLLTVRHPRGPFPDHVRASKQVLLDCALNGPGHLIYNDVSINDTVRPYHGDIMIEQTAMPSFKSYSMNLSYEIEVKIWGDCASQSFDRVVCRGPLIVCSNYQTNPRTSHHTKISEEKLQDERCDGESPPISCTQVEGAAGPSNYYNRSEGLNGPPHEECLPAYNPPTYTQSDGEAR